MEPTTNSSLPQPTPSTWKSMKWHRMRNMGNDETYIWKTTVVIIVNFSGVVKCSKEVKEAQNAAIISDNAVRILPHLVAYNVKNTFVKKLGSVSTTLTLRLVYNVLSQLWPSLHFKRNDIRSLHWISVEEEFCHERTTWLGDHPPSGRRILAEVEQGNVWWEGK